LLGEVRVFIQEGEGELLNYSTFGLLGRKGRSREKEGEGEGIKNTDKRISTLRGGHAKRSRLVITGGSLTQDKGGRKDRGSKN